MGIQISNIQRQISELSKVGPKIKNIESNFKPLEVDKEDLKLREASQKLEGQFLSFLIKSMEGTVPKEKDKQSLSSMMFSTVMGKEMSESGGIGTSICFKIFTDATFLIAAPTVFSFIL